MKLNVSENINSMNLNGEVIALLQTNTSPRIIIKSGNQTRLTLKTVQPNSFSKTHFAICLNLLRFLFIRTFCCICGIIEMFPHFFSVVIFVFHVI